MKPPKRDYQGQRHPSGCEVHLFSDEGDYPLDLRLDLCGHSPTGFEWGYAGSGPAQLALALLADATGKDRAAVRLHQAFKSLVVAHLDRESWWLTASFICGWAKLVGGVR